MNNIKQGKVCKTHEDFTVIVEINGHVIISEVPDTMISSKKFRNELLNLLDSLLRDDLDDDIKKTTTGKKIEKYFCQIASIVGSLLEEVDESGSRSLRERTIKISNFNYVVLLAKDEIDKRLDYQDSNYNAYARKN